MAPVPADAAPPPRSLASRLRRPAALVALSALALFAVLALLAPLLAPYDPQSQLELLALRSRPPSLAHPFGTDDVSRDVLSRVLYGGRVSLAVGVLATLVATGLGTLVGTVAGWAGGRVDAAVMRVVDTLLAMPRLLVLIAVFALWPGLPTWALVLLVGATAWFPMSRMVRAEVRAVRRRDHVLAARALGAGDLRLLRRHVLPGVLGTVIVAGTLLVGQMILLEAALSFLGVGVQPPDPSWGNIVRDGFPYMRSAWWISFFPGLAITVTVCCVNVLGDALRDALDPRQLPLR